MDSRVRVRLELTGKKPPICLRELDRLLMHAETLRGSGTRMTLGPKTRISRRRSRERLSAIVSTRG